MGCNGIPVCEEMGGTARFLMMLIVCDKESAWAYAEEAWCHKDLERGTTFEEVG